MNKFIIAVATMLSTSAFAIETAKPQDYASHIVNGQICGPLMLQDKTGNLIVNLPDDKSCLVLNKFVGFRVRQTPTLDH